ncbi:MULTISPECIES: DUF397 domain-containing protein [unclassified Streptomyces]|uniref:DUF397 domain-containing protein n=1 Tax=unclassified Streptomyces TaxID=2593676 RepID=UPI002E2E3529|nr:DUF397 domain-containing protein [Streptomyces sp. NBC_00223]
MSNPRPDLSAATWRKSSYSDNANPDSCVEVADGFEGVLPVRDSKDPQIPALVFPTPSWTAFVTAVKSGHFTP